jgi:hypothetical protein
MILGLSIYAFTVLHVVISLIGIVAGLVVLYGMIGALPKWSIALEETALVATFKPVSSGIWCARWTTVALRFRLRAP